MIKSTMTKLENKRPFPKLMQFISDSKEIVVFMIAEGEGVVVYQYSTNIRIGNYSNTWDMSQFKDFEGSITLTNI